MLVFFTHQTDLSSQYASSSFGYKVSLILSLLCSGVSSCLHLQVYCLLDLFEGSVPKTDQLPSRLFFSVDGIIYAGHFNFFRVVVPAVEIFPE